MLDSWVSPEAAGFFISFTEGQSPLLPAPLPLSAVSLSFLIPFSLCHHPSFSLSLSRSLSFFGALSPLSLCAYEIKDQSFVSSPMSGNLHSLWSPHRDGYAGAFPSLFCTLFWGKYVFLPSLPKHQSSPPYFFFIFVAKEKKGQEKNPSGI